MSLANFRQKYSFVFALGLLLRSESLSSKHAKLHTAAASSNRDQPTRSLYYCLFVPHIYIYISGAVSASKFKGGGRFSVIFGN